MMRIDGLAWDSENSSAKLAEKHFSTIGSVCGVAAGTSEFGFVLSWTKKKLFGKKESFFNMEKSGDWEKN